MAGKIEIMGKNMRSFSKADAVARAKMVEMVFYHIPVAVLPNI